MTDERTPEQPEATHVELEDLATFLVVGIHKDTHEPVVAASPNMTLPDMGMLLGRLFADFMMNTAGAGAFNAIQTARQQSQQSQASNIIHPGRFQK